jgi:hypothetical protein
MLVSLLLANLNLETCELLALVLLVVTMAVVVVQGRDMTA